MVSYHNWRAANLSFLLLYTTHTYGESETVYVAQVILVNFNTNDPPHQANDTSGTNNIIGANQSELD